jgi:hypothetical protein
MVLIERLGLQALRLRRSRPSIRDCDDRRDGGSKQAAPRRGRGSNRRRHSARLGRGASAGNIRRLAVLIMIDAGASFGERLAQGERQRLRRVSAPQSRLAAYRRPPGADELAACGFVAASDRQKSLTALARSLASVVGVFARTTALADLQQISIGQ